MSYLDVLDAFEVFEENDGINLEDDTEDTEYFEKDMNSFIHVEEPFIDYEETHDDLITWENIDTDDTIDGWDKEYDR